MRHDKRFRVVSANSVLNYYDNVTQAIRYMYELKDCSPDTFREADIELRYLGPDEDPFVWYTVSKLSY